LNKKLAKFLASDKRPEGTMTLPEVYGFLFTVCTAPEPVETAEWMEVVFNCKVPNYKSDEKRAKIETGLLKVFAEVEALVQFDEPQLPECIELLEPPIANVRDGAPLAFWSDGVFDGVDWLEDVWSSNLDEDAEEVWKEAVRVLVYFSHRDAAREMSAGTENAWVSDEHQAEYRLNALGEAMATYARMGRALAQANANDQPFVREVKIGRNDPCFCGSGLKYKKCCMNKAASA
jgi:yecA family protein